MAFIYSDYDVKEEIREIVKEHYPGGDILSLSADNFLFEKKFPKTKITSCETDILTYQRGIKARPKNVNYLNKDIFTVQGKFGLVWLDLCGVFTLNLVKNLLLYFRNSESQVIALTIQAKREQFAKYLEIYGAKDLEDFRLRAFPELITRYSKYELTSCYKYLSPNKSPMLLYIFKLK
jgi:hypothetical protein